MRVQGWGETMSERPTFEPWDYLMVSTKRSKYAHLSNWGPSEEGPMCYTPVPTFDPYSLEHMSQAYVTGKPVCQRCVDRMQHKARWFDRYAEGVARMLRNGEVVP